ncbi:hypothetical protein MTR_2g437280 [Medicago truncatula]|uniref:Retrotransposon gag domain-containing protein n=1 Tax=Medicago truncatula TaxID=3880 RepID=A0A072V5M1_MEDTR|nr:hypothetical protein MTR_2g437280 [Medicago truncatula]
MFFGEDPTDGYFRVQVTSLEGQCEGNVFEQLTSLQQEGQVEDFIENFECLISRVPCLSDEQFVGYIIHRLKEGIRGCVQYLITLGPASQHHLVNMAKEVEREIDG